MSPAKRSAAVLVLLSGTWAAAQDPPGLAVPERARIDGLFAASLSAETLAAYPGVYRSPELDVDYTIAEDGGALVLKRRRFDDRVLSPRGDDGFSAGSWRIQFTRDPSGPVDGFTITTGRVRNLRFLRR